MTHSMKMSMCKTKTSYFPKLCLWRVAKAIIAAAVWTTVEENNTHKNVWYHISENIKNYG